MLTVRTLSRTHKLDDGWAIPPKLSRLVTASLRSIVYEPYLVAHIRKAGSVAFV